MQKVHSDSYQGGGLEIDGIEVGKVRSTSGNRNGHNQMWAITWLQLDGFPPIYP